ncbi:hypothetical protein BpHYR1_022051 [Brachionus plicatilis]|uniref:Uncharacterized protein n=1 Tax=Brachionus plicatilis TaxID=10195 RepID=A0A3M7PSM7_BRAPC|nr:hypothetical protein BpHYR1_022051 [Brachionus plicatilis]
MENSRFLQTKISLIDVFVVSLFFQIFEIKIILETINKALNSSEQIIPHKEIKPIQTSKPDTFWVSDAKSILLIFFNLYKNILSGITCKAVVINISDLSAIRFYLLYFNKYSTDLTSGFLLLFTFLYQFLRN